MHRMCALFAAVVLAAVLAACGNGGSDHGAKGSSSSVSDGPGKGKPPVRLGTKNFTEQFILGQLYAQALRAKGWTVQLKENIGSTEVADKALTSGSIDLYPEYTGTGLSVVKGDTRRRTSPERTYQEAKAFYEARGQTLLERAPFEDRDAIAATKAFAQRNGLESMSDLKRLPGPLKIGAAPEFRTRFAGMRGLRSVYGLDNLTFEPIEIGDTYKALDDGRIQLADVFSTDGRLAGGDYVVLRDPEAIFGRQNLAPVVDRKVLQKQGRGFAETLDAVTGLLTDSVMQRMNAAVDLRGQTPEAVARAFLERNSLL